MFKSKHLSSKDYGVRAKPSRSRLKLSSQERGRIPGEDRLSNLPRSLIHHIFSKLPLEDAMRTMVLSKAWKDEWLTSPCLDLGKDMGDRFPADTQLRNKFLDFSFRILTRRNDLKYSSILRLHLFLPGPPEIRRTRSEKQTDELLCYAFTKFTINELKLSSYFEPPKYKLSEDTFQHVHSLRVLVLKCLKIDQQTIAILAVKCPFLKSLKLKCCEFIDMKMSISGFQKLGNLSVIATTSRGDDVKVEIIDAPSLVKLRYSGQNACRAKSPSIDVVSDSFYMGLNHMDLADVWFDQNSLSRVLSHLPNLQHLNLSCQFLCHERLDIYSPSLKHLELRLQNLLVQLHIDAPNLTDFVYTFHALNAMPIINPFNEESFNPEKATINIESGGKRLKNLLQDVLFSHFVKQLDGFSRHMIVQISVFYPDTLQIFEVSPPSVYDFKHLVLYYDGWDQCSWPPEPASSQDLFTALLDPALCLFPNLETCIILQRNSEWELMELKLQFEYKEFKVHDFWPFWEPRLREVKIENIRGSEMYISPLRTQFEEAMELAR